MDDRTSEHLDYEILAEIGKGAYGKVYKAREVRDRRRLLAVKKLNLPGDPSNGIPQVMVREVALLRKLQSFNHPNVVKLLDVSAAVRKQSLDLTLVFEYIDQDLASFLSTASEDGLARDKIKDVMQQLFTGLDFLHSNAVIHRDLKPDNVLVSCRGEVKIADFGLARIYTYNIALTPCVRAVAGVPAEEDWPKDSPIQYNPAWRSEPGTHLLPACLRDKDSDLLAVSASRGPYRE
uniref:cyclin-dependent kinase n=1 Tax=Electrophorus electricus TaxID=8005 RepID=A0A4W4FT71_ELEEL